MMNSLAMVLVCLGWVPTSPYIPGVGLHIDLHESLLINMAWKSHILVIDEDFPYIRVVRFSDWASTLSCNVATS